MLEKTIEIKSNREISPDTFLLELISAELANESKPGQFVMIRVENGTDPLLRRPFSIYDTDNNGTVKILYRVVGKGTRILSCKKNGDFLTILGPLGSKFKFPDSIENVILVAGGIGIAPLFYLGQNLLPGNFEFLTGFRSSQEIINIESNGSRQSIEVSLTTDDGSFGYHGRVTDLLEDILKGNNNKYSRIYACGPLPMLKQTALTAEKFNIPCQVSIEAFMACGLGVCQGCAVKVTTSEAESSYQRVCMEGPVFDAEILDWASL